ncbi:unnamed protein product [Dicrocoelium dendriticum]|nr:unnamed protein product [Dicrocoelium dendriticum]
MSDADEERQNELTALESIYEDKLRILRNDGLQRFEVCLLGRGEADAAVSCECTIVFEYTERYPHEKPIYDICNVKGLTSDQVGELHRSLDSVAQRSLGYIMIFDMLSEVQERLNFTCERRLAMQAKADEAKRKALELEEEARLLGDRVTVESFMEWNEKFKAEMASLKEKVEVDENVTKRLTGRELFLRDNRYDDSDVAFLAENGEAIEIDDRLFADIADLDLSDDSLGDSEPTPIRA